jgi:hypothetical protein
MANDTRKEQERVEKARQRQLDRAEKAEQADAQRAVASQRFGALFHRLNMQGRNRNDQIDPELLGQALELAVEVFI